MANIVSFQGRKLRINGERIEYFHEGAGQWMDDGPAPSGLEDLYVKLGTLYAKDYNGVEYKRSEYGGFSPVVKKTKKEKTQSSSSKPKSKKPLGLKIILFPFWLIWKIIVFIWKAIPG